LAAFIESRIAESVAVKQALLRDRAAIRLISEIAAAFPARARTFPPPGTSARPPLFHFSQPRLLR
jgi:hypothetical protein